MLAQTDRRQLQDPVARLRRDVRVRHENARGIVELDLLTEQVEHLRRALRIEIARGLVGEYQPRCMARISAVAVVAV